MTTAVDRKQLFAGLKEAKQNVDANYVKPGTYWFAVNMVKPGKNREDEPFLALEFKVAKVVTVGDAAPAPNSHKIGEEPTHLLKNAGKQKKYFLGELKGFLACVLDLDATDIDVEHAMLASEDPCPIENVTLLVVARPVDTQEGKVFTRIRYKSIIPNKQILAEVPKDVRDRVYGKAEDGSGMIEALIAAEAAED